MAQRVIGIDFGTSTSVIRVKRYDDKGKPLGERLDTKEVVFGGQNMVPSMIRKIEGHAYYGYEALPSKRNSVLCQNFKIDLENPDMSMAQEAREKTEEFFNYMAKRYFEQRDGSFLGEVTDTERTIVSYPVKWGQGTRKFILDSAKKAGFKNVEGMDVASRISLKWNFRSIVLLKPDGSIWSDDTDIQNRLGNIRDITALGRSSGTLIQKDRCLKYHLHNKETSYLRNNGWENIRDIIPIKNVSLGCVSNLYVGITNDNRVTFSQNKDEGVLTWISSKWDNIKK